MLRPLLRLALVFSALAVALLLLVHLPAYDDAQIARFFDRETCIMPCWQGIRPGVTTMNQALAILSAHPWVAAVTLVHPVPYDGSTAVVLLYWTWNRDYPFSSSLTYSEQGIAITEKGVVRQIYLTSSIPFGAMWLALGGADGGSVNYQYDDQRVRIDNTALYAGEGVAATAMLTADCASAYPDLWRTPVYMWLRDIPPVNQAAYARYLRALRGGYRQVWGTLC